MSIKSGTVNDAFKIGDKVRILANFYTKGLEICGQQAVIISTYTNERPKQVKVQLQNGDKYYLLLSEIEKIEDKQKEG